MPWVRVPEVWVGHSLDPTVHPTLPREASTGIGAALQHPQPGLLSLHQGWGVIQLPVGSIDAASQLSLPGFFPALESLEHATVQNQHDRAWDEEGADGGIHDVVVILQLAQAGVPVWDIVEAKYDWGCHSKGEYPGGGYKDQLPQVDLPPVVVEWDLNSDEPANTALGESVLVWWHRGNVTKGPQTPCHCPSPH